MRVDYSEDARAALLEMPKKDAATLVHKIQLYANTGRGDVRKLVGLSLSRLRHGNWRAVLDLVDGVYVVRIAHRRDVYR